jgi:hypothetical protein
VGALDTLVPEPSATATDDVRRRLRSRSDSATSSLLMRVLGIEDAGGGVSSIGEVRSVSLRIHGGFGRNSGLWGVAGVLMLGGVDGLGGELADSRVVIGGTERVGGLGDFTKLGELGPSAVLLWGLELAADASDMNGGLLEYSAEVETDICFEIDGDGGGTEDSGISTFSVIK